MGRISAAAVVAVGEIEEVSVVVVAFPPTAALPRSAASPPAAALPISPPADDMEWEGDSQPSSLGTLSSLSSN